MSDFRAEFRAEFRAKVAHLSIHTLTLREPPPAFSARIHICIQFPRAEFRALARGGRDGARRKCQTVELLRQRKKAAESCNGNLRRVTSNQVCLRVFRVFTLADTLLTRRTLVDTLLTRRTLADTLLTRV